MLRSRLWLLLPWLVGACALPVNTALRDWSRLADTAVAGPAAAPPAEAMQQALSLYFQALGVLWDGAPLTFDAPGFAALARQLPDPAPAGAILALGEVLRAASEEVPPRWLPRDNSGPTPAYEDRRLTALLRGAEAPMRVLLLALAAPGRAEAPAPPAPGEATSDPALRQARLEQEAERLRLAAEGRAAGAQYVAVLDHVLEGQAVLAAHAGRIRQRSTELRLRLAEDRLRRILDGRDVATAGP
ncbi:hypothetical protein EJV46_10375 [Roseococcus sp. SYP-B2431]|uniref:hypothetical protein n=1 Tax=Roseococcus sp. SYP-B2431 TaxID=2496640 RepID=UPI0010398F2F|nr:hypothetical protein [Roseococcus sp. SYP-B2431]TCH98949.1 hypothetical protein EJV46_10375 [Roseococcus sp. SYP-B2431]